MENATFASPRGLKPGVGEGTLAQMVEQRTENPCVPGSIPGGTTLKKTRCEPCLFCFSSREDKFTFCIAQKVTKSLVAP